MLTIYDRGRVITLGKWNENDTKQSFEDRLWALVESSSHSIRLGDVRMSEDNLLKLEIPIDYYPEEIKLIIRIHADNGEVTQSLRMINWDTDRKTAYEVQDAKGKVLIKYNDEGFPLNDDGTIPWD